MPPVPSVRSGRPSRLPARTRDSGPPRRWALLAATMATLLVVAGCSGGAGAGDSGGADGQDVRLEHVHGLGVDPGDGVLYAGTHHGLMRISPGGELTRIADRVQDFMGFTVVGPDHYLAGGHPGPGQSGPGNLGLLETTDGGQNWTTLSLAGEADFHALAAADGAVYGYSGGRLLVSENGVDWTDRGGLRIADLAVDPSASERLLATSEQGVILSEDGGETFRVLAGAPRLLLIDFSADATSAVGVSPEGAVHASTDGGLTWAERGDVGGAPAALAVDGQEVYVAVNGAIVASTDGGGTFSDFYRAD
jgi:photosystem II stability/assembly factor-like uncharacterized protein